MGPARRTALISVLAATFLIAVKLGVGLATNSLGFLSEAAHSGTDLVAALLTFFALGVASRPADASHGWGHGKAEHLSALAECAVLGLVSVAIAAAAIRRLVSDAPPEVETTWWAFAVLGLVIVVDLTRTIVSHRAATRHASAALAANALHFGSDLLGTIAVLVGLGLTRAGIASADAYAALFVAGLVLTAAGRMARVNIDVLMDRTPFQAEAAARAAIADLGPDIRLRRLRMREAAGSHFADVVISVAPSAALAEGHAAADAVEAAIQRELPHADVVVKVEPGVADDSDIREQALTAALSVAGVREIHNVQVFHHEDGPQVALHLKLPSSLPLTEAHRVADAVEGAIGAACATVTHVTTHLEPIAPPISADAPHDATTEEVAEQVTAIVGEITGYGPHELRLSQTDDGIVAFLAIGVDGRMSLADAHDLSGAVRRRIRTEIDDLHDVVVHTEPLSGPGDGPGGPRSQIPG